MVVKAYVMYRGALAQYFVTQENEGIFNAHLARYDGRVDHFPPYKLTLIRGTYQWTGDPEDPVLIESIGKVIDKKLQDTGAVFRPASGNDAPDSNYREGDSHRDR